MKLHEMFVVGREEWVCVVVCFAIIFDDELMGN